MFFSKSVGLNNEKLHFYAIFPYKIDKKQLIFAHACFFLETHAYSRDGCVLWKKLEVSPIISLVITYSVVFRRFLPYAQDTEKKKFKTIMKIVKRTFRAKCVQRSCCKKQRKCSKASKWTVKHQFFNILCSARSLCCKLFFVSQTCRAFLVRLQLFFAV